MDERIAFISLFGIFLLSVLVSLPAIGIIASAITAFMGLGAILLVATYQMRALRDQVLRLRFT